MSILDEQAIGGISSVRSPFELDVVTGLTPEKLALVLRRAKDGDQNEYLSMVSEMEKRDTHYFSVLRNRKLAIKQLEIFIDEPKGGDDTKAVELCRSTIGSSAFRGQILHFLDALSKGYSVTEILWRRSDAVWEPNSYLWRNQRWFQWDMDTATVLSLYDGTVDGIPLLPYKYIIHQPTVTSGLALAGGLGRIISVLHLFKGYAMKDWMTFAEVFGLPLRIGKYPNGASEDQKEALREAVTMIGSDAAAIIPESMKIEFERVQSSGSSGDNFFLTLCNWLNKETSKAVLGQTMTTEDGSSLAQAKIHEEVRMDIRNADARELEDTINRDLIIPLVDLNFGKRPRESDYPRFGIDTTEDEDLDLWLRALPILANHGLQIPVVFVRNLFGLPEPKGDEETLSSDTKELPTMASTSEIIDIVNRATNIRKLRQELQERFGGQSRGKEIQKDLT